MAPIPDQRRAEEEEDAEEDAVMADAQQPQNQGGAEEGDAVMTDADGAAAAAPEAAGATIVPPTAKEPTKITAQKFNYIRSMLAKKLTEVQQEQVRRSWHGWLEDILETRVGASRCVSLSSSENKKRCTFSERISTRSDPRCSRGGQ